MLSNQNHEDWETKTPRRRQCAYKVANSGMFNFIGKMQIRDGFLLAIMYVGFPHVENFHFSF